MWVDVSETERQVDIAIIGGGIAGLAVAFRLAVSAPHLETIVLESANRLGGKILTERVEHDDGTFIVEAGPDAFLAAKPWARDLSVELGLADRIIPITALPRSTGILKNGHYVDLPDGIALIAPTKLAPLVRTSLLSWRGKARAGLDLVIPKRKDAGDESLGSFVRRRLGSEVLDWIAEPLAAGIYNADPDRLSLAATLPHLQAVERAHGSLIRGLRQASLASTGPKSPAFLSFRGGMQELVDALAGRVREHVLTGSSVTAISQTGDGYYRLSLGQNGSLTAKQVVLAISAAEAANALSTIAPDATSLLQVLRADTAGTLSLALRDQDIGRPLPGYGLVVPRREGLPFNAITVSSRKFEGRAPSGWTLLRLFFGGFRSPQTLLYDDDRLVAEAMRFLRAHISAGGLPGFARIHRWVAASAQYDVGHLERIGDIERALPPGFHLLGSAFTGVGIPDIVRTANETAAKLIAVSASGGPGPRDAAAT